MLHVGGGDGVEEALGKRVSVACGEAGGGDRVADDDGDGAGMKVVGVDGEELVGSDECYGDEGNLGFDGHVGATGEEGVGAAVGGAAPFGEEDEGKAMFKGVDAAVEAGYGVAGARLVDGDLAGAVEIPADKGNFPKGLFGEDAELEGKFGKEDGSVEIAEVV